MKWLEIRVSTLKWALRLGVLGAYIAMQQHKARPLNLDLHLAFDVPAVDPLRLNVPGSKNLVVDSPGAGESLSFVLRNQEWPKIFAESQHLKEPTSLIGTDFDQEYFRELASRGLGRMSIPVPADGSPLAPLGQGCGGKTRGY